LINPNLMKRIVYSFIWLSSTNAKTLHRILHNLRPHSQPWISQPDSLTVSFPCNLLSKVAVKWKTRPHARFTFNRQVCGLIWLSKFMRRICEFEYLAALYLYLYLWWGGLLLSCSECKQNKVAHLWQRWLPRRVEMEIRRGEQRRIPSPPENQENVCAPPIRSNWAKTVLGLPMTSMAEKRTGQSHNKPLWFVWETHIRGAAC